MFFKEGITPHDVDHLLFYILQYVDDMHREYTGEEITVTSFRRPPGDRPSGHSPPPRTLVYAADVRDKKLRELALAEQFCRRLQLLFGRFLGVVLEPDWLTAEEIAERGGIETITPHVHLQLKHPWRT